jgi:hypothetical protein
LEQSDLSQASLRPIEIIMAKQENLELTNTDSLLSKAKDNSDFVQIILSQFMFNPKLLN